MVAHEAQEVERAIELQTRANEIVIRTLRNKALMVGAFASREQESKGETGEPWADVKARLGLV